MFPGEEAREDWIADPGRCIDVIERPLVVVIRSWSWPISSANVGW